MSSPGGVGHRRARVTSIVGTLPLVASAALLAAACGDDLRGDPGPTTTLSVTTIGAPETTEAAGEAVLEIVLTEQPESTVTVTVSTSNELEGFVPSPTLNFSVARWDVPQRVVIRGVDDDRADGDQLYRVEVVAGPAGREELALVNRDDDAVGVAVVPTTPTLETSEAGGTATFTVALTSEPTAPVMIPVVSTDPAEGTVSTAVLAFTPDNWEGPQTVTVTGMDDALVDGNRAFAVTLGPAMSLDPKYLGFDAQDLALTNLDNDSANIFVEATTPLTTTEAGGTASFSLVLLAAPTADVTIAVASSTPGEGTVAPATVTFTPANWNAPRTVTVTGVDDLVADGARDYTIQLGPVTSTDAAYAALDPADVPARNLDDDSAGVRLTAAPGLTTSEAGGTAQFTVVLLSQPTSTVTIPVTSTDVTEGAASPASLVFDGATWDQAQTVTVTGVDDALPDGDVVYVVALGAATSLDPAYMGFDPADATLTNIDNEVSGITVTPTSGLVTSEFGDSDTFEIVLNAQPTADVSIALSSSDTTEAVVDRASVTFTQFNWSTPQTVTVTGQNDAMLDGDQPYTIVTAAATSADTTYAGIDPANVTGANTDDESPTVFVNTNKRLSIGENGQRASFRMRLTTQPTAPVTCQLASNDPTEGTVAASITFTLQNYDQLQAVQVIPVDDALDDGDQLFRISVGPCASDDPAYNNFDPRDVSVVTRDDD